jgi:hypothetical protein
MCRQGPSRDSLGKYFSSASLKCLSLAIIRASATSVCVESKESVLFSWLCYRLAPGFYWYV